MSQKTNQVPLFKVAQNATASRYATDNQTDKAIGKAKGEGMILDRMPAEKSAVVHLRDEDGKGYTMSRELATALGIVENGKYELIMRKLNDTDIDSSNSN